MNPIFAALGRLVAISSVAFGVATVSNYFNHRGYWYGTIFRVQTTDFNILSHTLPTKLSYAMQQKDYAELQRTLNSNYGLFGMVVTDCITTTIECLGQQILYATESRGTWRQKLNIQDLRGQPYDVLRNPPPLIAEGGFKNSRAQNWNVRGNLNPGQVIGRVYYIRGIPPEFWADYSGWLEKLPLSLFSDSGAHKYYTLTVSLFLSSGLAAWGFIERVKFQKRLQIRLARQETLKLLRQLERQEHLLAELKYYRDEQETSIHSLKQEIARYKNGLRQKELEQQHGVQSLKGLNQQLQKIQQLQVKGQEQLQQKEQAIASLQAEIKIQEREKQQRDESLRLLQYALQTTQNKLTSTSSFAQSLDNSIASITQERGLALQRVEQLEAQLKLTTAELREFEDYATQENQKLVQENQQLKLIIAELKEFENYAGQENQQLRNELDQQQYKHERLETEKLQLKAQIEGLEELLKSNKTQTINLSNLRLALVGGHQSTRRKIIQELQSECGLQCASVVEIPPSSEQRTNQNYLRSKIGNCTLVAVLTEYCDHSLSNMVSNLKEREALAGEVILCSGKNDTISKIMQWATGNPHLLH